jgi:uncharacterized protein (DUF58 family)
MIERWLRALFLAGILSVLFKLPVLTLVVSIILALACVSLLMRWIAFRRVRYVRTLSETRSFVGERISLQTRLSNNSRLPLFSLQVFDFAPKPLIKTSESVRPQIIGTDDLSLIAALRPRSTHVTAYQLVNRQRGYFQFDAATLRAVDVLGISEMTREENVNQSLLVYPRVFSLDEVRLPERQPLGALASLRRLIEDPSRHMGARDYMPGDSFKQIHWAMTAHRGSLQTRINEHTADPISMIMLNVTTFEDDWVGCDVERFEWAVSVAASIASWAHEAGATIGLSSNGAAPGAPEMIRVKPRRSPDQLTHVLESLAIVAAFTAVRFEEFLINDQRHVPFGSSLIVVTPIVTPRMLIALEQLRQMGKRIALVSCDRVPPSANAPCEVIHLPPEVIA